MLHLARETIAIPIHADFSFNLFNAGAVEMLAELGAAQATLSLEATLAQAVAIRAASALPLEVIVHGSLPGMVLAQCVIAARTLNATPDDPCPAPCQSQQYALRDRLGQIHPIEPDQYCRNHLLMGKDLCALRHLDPFLRAGFASLRLELPYADEALVGLATALYRTALDRFAAGRRGRLIDEEEFEQLGRLGPRPFSLGGFATASQTVALPEGELPTNLIIRYDQERVI
jgi:putative protease